MRPLYAFWLFASLLLAASPAWAQWSADISNPLVVADSAKANGGDGHVRALPDGSGGYYIFWLDGRGDQVRDKRLYGQHLSEQGTRLWGAGGKLIARAGRPYPGTLWEYEVVQTPQGDLLACYNEGESGQDTLYAIRINKTDGSLAWRTYVIGRTIPESGRILYVTEPHMIPIDNGAYINYHLAVLYYNEQLHVNKIDRDGNLPWGSPRGPAVPSAVGGPSFLLPSQNGGGLLVWRQDNGAGTHMWARGFSADSNLVGSADQDLSAGTNGLAYDFAPLPDSAGGALIPYVTNDSPVQLWGVRINQQASLLWSPVRKAISSGTGTPVISPIALRNGGRTYVAWGGLRAGTTGTFDTYVQALDDAGNPLWANNGILIPNFDVVYYCYAKMAPTQDGGIVIAGPSSTGVHAQRLRPDGTFAWDSAAHITDQAHNTDLRDFELLANGPNFQIIWRTGLGAMYASRVSAEGQLGVTTAIRPALAGRLHLSPNPAGSRLTLGLPPGAKAQTVTVYDQTGRQVTVPVLTGTTLSTGHLTPGLYTLRVETPAGAYSARFVKE